MSDTCHDHDMTHGGCRLLWSRATPPIPGEAMMHGTIQTLDAKGSFGFIRDTGGAKVFFRRSALTPPASFASLAVGMRVEFEPELGPKGPRTAKITVTPVETPPGLSFEELAAHFQRHAAG